MIFSVIFEIIFYWISMGIILAIAMTGFLYFAVLCEKIIDLLSTDKYHRERFDQP